MLRYIREAPLANLPQEVQQLEGRCQTARLLRDLQQHAEVQEARTSEQAALLAKVLAELGEVQRQARGRLGEPKRVQTRGV